MCGLRTLGDEIRDDKDAQLEEAKEIIRALIPNVHCSGSRRPCVACFWGMESHGAPDVMCEQETFVAVQKAKEFVR